MKLRLTSLVIAVLCVALAGCVSKAPRVEKMVAAAPPAAAVAPAKLLTLGVVMGGQTRKDVGGWGDSSPITEQDLRAAVDGSLKASGLQWSGTTTPPRTLTVVFLTAVHTRFPDGTAGAETTINFVVQEADGTTSFQQTFTHYGRSTCFCLKPSSEFAQEASEEAVRGTIRMFLDAWLALP